MDQLNNFRLTIKGEQDLSKFKNYITNGQRSKYYPTHLESWTDTIINLTLAGVGVGLMGKSLEKLKLK